MTGHIKDAAILLLIGGAVLAIWYAGPRPEPSGEAASLDLQQTQAAGIAALTDALTPTVTSIPTPTVTATTTSTVAPSPTSLPTWAPDASPGLYVIPGREPMPTADVVDMPQCADLIATPRGIDRTCEVPQ